MSKLMKLKLILNKKNGQVNMSIPKKKLSMEDKKNICKYKTARIFLEGFDE